MRGGEDALRPNQLGTVSKNQLVIGYGGASSRYEGLPLCYGLSFIT